MNRTLEDRLDALLDCDLASIVEDIFIEDEDMSSSDLDHSDMVGEIIEWVESGVTAGNWTEESWIAEILDDPDSDYVTKISLFDILNADGNFIDMKMAESADEALNKYNQCFHEPERVGAKAVLAPLSVNEPYITKD